MKSYVISQIFRGTFESPKFCGLSYITVFY